MLNLYQPLKQKVSVFFVLCLTLSFVLPTLVHAQPGGFADDSGKIRVTRAEKTKLIKAQNVLRGYASLKKFSGVVIIARNGEPLYKFASGFANFDYRIPNSLTAKYNGFGITRCFTATAIMQLAEKGKINIYSPIKMYLPDLPVEMGELTIHHLLTETGGVPDYYTSMDYHAAYKDMRSIDDLVSIIAKHTGECNTSVHEESNSAYVLLGAIVERTSGLSFQEYIEKKLLEPINSENIGLFFWDETVANRAVGYNFTDESDPLIAPQAFGAFPYGDDALYVNVLDMLKFETAFFNSSRLVSMDSRDVMLTDYASELNPNTAYGYGYGWKMKENDKTGQVFFQNGSMDGLSTDYRYYSDKGYSLVVLSNYYDERAAEVCDALEKAIFDDDFLVPIDPIAFLLSQELDEQGTDYVVQNLDAILTEKQLKIDAVWTLNTLGRSLMDERMDPENARLILEKNKNLFPQEDIVYDSLGECQFKLGNFQAALANFEKRLQLLPGDKRSLAMIEVIKEAIAENK